MSLSSELQSFRKEMAARDKVPSYFVFNNETMEVLASISPRSMKELGEIKGIGPNTLKEYGKDILAVLMKVGRNGPKQGELKTKGQEKMKGGTAGKHAGAKNHAKMQNEKPKVAKMEQTKK